MFHDGYIKSVKGEYPGTVIFNIDVGQIRNQIDEAADELLITLSGCYFLDIIFESDDKYLIKTEKLEYLENKKGIINYLRAKIEKFRIKKLNEHNDKWDFYDQKRRKELSILDFLSWYNIRIEGSTFERDVVSVATNYGMIYMKFENLKIELNEKELTVDQISDALKRFWADLRKSNASK